MGAGSSTSGSGAVRRSNSWAVQDSSKVIDKPLSNSFKLQMQCALHEIGTQRGCRSENYLQQRGYGALVGLHSNWIGHFILAAARPSDRIISEHHLIYQLHSQHIGAVINLQEPGEHPGCGDGILQRSGFSYTPERFMEKNVLYFNFPVKDARSLSFSYVLDICHIIDSQIAAGEKVLVHCHSGIARTGLVIACYFLYSGAYEDPMEAIQTIQNERPGSLKTTRQVQLVKDFDTFLSKLRLCYLPPDQLKKRSGNSMGNPNLLDFMKRQKKLLHGFERRALLYVPKIVDWTTRELIKRTDFNRLKREKVAGAFMLAFTTPRNKLNIDKDKKKVNAADWGGEEEVDIQVLCLLLIEWLRQLQEPIVPDVILTTVMGRGDIVSAIDELSKADKCSFATIQILACFIFQIVPVKPKFIRQLYSALAHVLLASSFLQETKDAPAPDLPEVRPESAVSAEKSRVISPNTPRRHKVTRINDVYTKFKPTLLEIEYGLLLEASARFWIKLGNARHADQETQRKSSGSSSTSPDHGKERRPTFHQPWFRDRASLQFEQYNPAADALKHQKEMEAPDEGSSSTLPSRTSSGVDPSPPRSPRS